jgi:hypothetical protein
VLVAVVAGLLGRVAKVLGQVRAIDPVGVFRNAKERGLESFARRYGHGEASVSVRIIVAHRISSLEIRG